MTIMNTELNTSFLSFISTDLTPEQLRSVREKLRQEGLRPQVSVRDQSKIDNSSSRLADRGCGLCVRTPGLAIYPARYAAMLAPLAGLNAVAPSVPHIKGALTQGFGIEGKDLEPKGRAQYTLRELRSGYFYVWVERTEKSLHKSGWLAFRVYEEGLLWPYDPDSATPALTEYDVAAKSCLMISGDMFHARYFTIPEPDQVNYIQYVWSNVSWLKPQFETLGADEQARQYMQKIDITKWQADSQNLPHTAPIKELVHWVAPMAVSKESYSDYADDVFSSIFSALDPNSPYKSNRMKYCPYYFMFEPLSGVPSALLTGPINAGILEAEMLKISSPENPPMILAAHDPLGITQDLALLTQSILHGDDHNTAVRDWWTNILLNGLESAVEQNKRTLQKTIKLLEDIIPVGGIVGPLVYPQNKDSQTKWSDITQYIDKSQWDYTLLDHAKELIAIDIQRGGTHLCAKPQDDTCHSHEFAQRNAARAREYSKYPCRCAPKSPDSG